MYKITDSVKASAMLDKPWHPVAALFPLMDEDEFSILCESVKAQGIRQPVETYNGEVIDGRNRQLAGIATGKDVPYCELEGEWPTDKLARYSWSANYERRHLNPSQKGLAASRMREYLAGVGDKVKIAAAATGASERMVKRTSRILEQGAPELVQAVESGTVTADDAEKILSFPIAQQVERVAAVNAGRAKRVSQPQADSGTSDQDAWLQGVKIPYDASVSDIKKTIARFEELHEQGELIHFPWTRIKVDLESARSMIEQNSPHVYCCGGDRGKDCVCGGIGFITRYNFDNPEIRSKLEAVRK